MQRMRRVLTGAVVVGLAVSLAACSGGQSGEASKTLSINSTWTSGSPQGDALKAVIAAFEKKTGVKVKLIETGDPLTNTWETDVAGGKEADMVLDNFTGKAVDWVKHNAVVKMDDYLKSWGLSGQIRPDAVSQWRDSNGSLVGLPYSGFIWPTWYNTTLLKKAGIESIPTTTDQLIQDAGKLRAAGIEPVSIAGGDWNGQKLFQQIAQMYSPAKETEKVFAKGGYCASPDIMKGIKEFVKLRDAGVFIQDAQGYQNEQQSNAYYTGKAAIMPAGSWAFSEPPASIATSTTLAGFPVPTGAKFNKPVAYNGYSSTGLMVSPRGIKNNEQNVESFVKFMYQPDSIATFVKHGTVVATTTSGSKQPTSNSSVLLNQALNGFDKKVDFTVMPDTLVPASAADPLVSATAQAFAPGHDAQFICKAVDAVYPTAG